jgi:hypothetical protein
MDDEKDKDELDELKGEVLLPEVDEELPIDEEDDPLLHKHIKKIHDEENPDEDSLDKLIDEELDGDDEPFDDVDNW